MKYSLRSLMILVTLACIVLAVCGVTAKLVKPSVIYEYRFAATAMPPNDTALEEWTRSQPGIVRSYVNRETNAIRITFIISRDLLGTPANPNFSEGLRRLGYKGEGEYVP